MHAEEATTQLDMRTLASVGAVIVAVIVIGYALIAWAPDHVRGVKDPQTEHINSAIAAATR